MPYVYRYVDMSNFETIYIGKVKGFKDVFVNPLENRHKQHTAEKWYRKNSATIIMQYIECASHTDADMLETWLINYYDTGQLLNKSKSGWGKSQFSFYPYVFGKWKTYDLKLNFDDIMSLAFKKFWTCPPLSPTYDIAQERLKEYEYYTSDLGIIGKDDPFKRTINPSYLQREFKRGVISQKKTPDENGL